METKKNKLLPAVAWRVTETEMHMINTIKKELVRSSNSDVLRFLVHNEYEKILNKNNTTVLNMPKEQKQ